MRLPSVIMSALAALALLVFMVPAQAQDSTADRYLAEMIVIADALEGITDDASAAAASQKMAAALERLQPIGEEMQAWSDADKMNFIRTYSEQYIGAQTRISQALATMVQNPERLKLFTGYMKNMPKLD